MELANELPGVVAARILDALAAVATKALQGQEVATVERLRPVVEKVVAEVFARVLAGYETTGVTIVPGEVTLVRLHVAPEGPVIREAYTRLEVAGVDPALQPLLSENLPSLDRAVLTLLGGLPVRSLAWARFALEPLLARELERWLPGFAVETSLEAGEVTTVTARLSPRGERVRRVVVRLNSDTVPAVALQQLNAELTSRASLMNGLPVAFLQAYRTPIEQEIGRRVREAPSIRRWGLAARTRLVPGPETVLELGVESTAWRARLEGVLNVGVDAPEPELRFLGGWRVGPGEVLVGSQLVLTGLEHRLQLGVGVPVGWEGELSYLWGTDEWRSLRLQKRISAVQRYAVEWSLPARAWRLSYGVAASKYLTVELVLGGGTGWISLIGNL